MGRRLSEQQAAKLLRRATEIQSQSSESKHVGIGLDELRAAATELGIDAAAFDAAVADLDAADVSDRPGFFGGPRRTEREVIVEGVLTEDAWEETVADLRKSFGEQGKVEVRGSTREWTTTGGGTTETMFTARQVGDQVRLSVQDTTDGLAAVFHLVSMPLILLGAALMGAIPGLGLALGILLRVIWAVGLFVGTRALVSKGCRKRRDHWSQVLHRTASRISAASGLRETLSNTLAENPTPSDLPVSH